MVKVKSIILLFIMGIMLFPWQAICLAHPFGHKHQEHKGPSLCELKRQYNGTDLVFWPPMHCENLFSQIDDFEQPAEKGINSLQTFAFSSILFDFIVRQGYENDLIRIPEARSNSDPPLLSITDRGPPIV